MDKCNGNMLISAQHVANHISLLCHAAHYFAHGDIQQLCNCLSSCCGIFALQHASSDCAFHCTHFSHMPLICLMQHSILSPCISAFETRQWRQEKGQQRLFRKEGDRTLLRAPLYSLLSSSLRHAARGCRRARRRTPRCAARAAPVCAGRFSAAERLRR